VIGDPAAFAARVRKNQKHLARWLRNHGVTCYRLYDKEVPPYAVALDVYGTREGDHLHVQEYEPPEHVDPAEADRHLDEVLDLLPELCGVPAERTHLKLRRRQKGASQYERFGRRGELLEVVEGPCTFLVNLTDYLDSGLFLDHRPLRRQIGEEAAGRRFLNLFCYTATATVHAALGGAVASTSVDLSATYLDWARRNFRKNRLDLAAHALVQADARTWLDAGDERFDLVLLDPPTFSNSKRMQGTFDVQRDHAPLVRAAVRRLAPDGTLYFSNNHRRFRLDTAALADLDVRDITRATIPKDFERTPRIHGCWRVRRPRPGTS